MIRRILPHPVLSLLIVLVWMALVNRFAWGSLVFAAILALVIPWLTAPYWPGNPRVRGPLRIAAYLALVLWDIVRANIEVARIVLFTPNADLRPAWIAVPPFAGWWTQRAEIQQVWQESAAEQARTRELVEQREELVAAELVAASALQGAPTASHRGLGGAEFLGQVLIRFTFALGESVVGDDRLFQRAHGSPI